MSGNFHEPVTHPLGMMPSVKGMSCVLMLLPSCPAANSSAVLTMDPASTLYCRIWGSQRIKSTQFVPDKLESCKTISVSRKAVCSSRVWEEIELHNQC